MVTSFIPGRIRLRAPVFKDEELCAKARKILESSDAVKSVEHNPVTGSILLLYDPERVPMDKLMPMEKFFMRLGFQAMNFSQRNREQISAMLDELADYVKEW